MPDNDTETDGVTCDNVECDREPSHMVTYVGESWELCERHVNQKVKDLPSAASIYELRT